MNEREAIIAKSYARLIENGRKNIEDVPEQIIPYLQEIAPHLFEDNK